MQMVNQGLKKSIEPSINI